MPLKFYGYRREYLTNLLLTTPWAGSNGVLVEGLLLGKVVAAVLATIMIGRHRSFPPLIIILCKVRINTHILAVGQALGMGAIAHEFYYYSPSSSPVPSAAVSVKPSWVKIASTG